MDEAATLPAAVGLRWATDAVRRREWDAYMHAQTLHGLYTTAAVTAGVAPPEPPEPPED